MSYGREYYCRVLYTSFCQSQFHIYFKQMPKRKSCARGRRMNSAIPYFLPFIEAIQKHSQTVEITLDRPNRSQSSGTLDTYVTQGSNGMLRGSVGTLWYIGEPKAYMETLIICFTGEGLFIELAPHESPLPIERFPVQNYVPLPYGLSISGIGFTATLSFSPYRRPANNAPPASRVGIAR